jgi:hypothetical protein
MYAVSMSSRVYHLLYASDAYTLCGFKALDLKVSDSNKPARLHRVLAIPANRSLCKQCEKMAQRRTRAGTALMQVIDKPEKLDGHTG